MPAEGVGFTPGSGIQVSADLVDSKYVQYVKIMDGTDGSGTVLALSGGAVPVVFSSSPTVTAVGNVASGVADSGNPVKIGLKYNTTAPTLTDGQRVDGQADSFGNLKIALGANIAGENLTSDVLGVATKMVAATTYSPFTYDSSNKSVGTATITNASPGVVTKTAHGLKVGDAVYFTTTGGLPTGLSVNTAYYLIAAGFTANDFQLSATVGGAAINTSSAGSGTHTLVSLRVVKGSVKAALGNLISGLVSSKNTAVTYLQFFNQTTTPTAGTVATISIPLPAGTSTVPSMTLIPTSLLSTAGLSLSTGVAYAISSTDLFFTDACPSSDHTVFFNYV